jgi:hypothetical protein
MRSRERAGEQSLGIPCDHGGSTKGSDNHKTRRVRGILSSFYFLSLINALLTGNEYITKPSRGKMIVKKRIAGAAD